MKNKTKSNLATVAIIIMVAVTMLLAGCAAAADREEDKDYSLSDMVFQLCKDVDVPAYEITELTKDTFESFTFVPYKAGMEAVAADALVNITPHSLVVIRTDGNGKDIAETIMLNADPNKWLCVGAEVVNVAYTDNYVVLVMSDAATAKAIIGNFKSIAINVDDMEMNLLTADNSRFSKAVNDAARNGNPILNF